MSDTNKQEPPVKHGDSAMDGSELTPDISEQKYRDLLTNLEIKSQEKYDKAVLALSGGAFAISFAFVGNFIKTSPPSHAYLLALSWGCFLISLVCVLFSFYESQRALRTAITQLDSGKRENLGESYDQATARLNFSSGLFFVLGAIAIICFASFNLPIEENSSQKAVKQSDCGKTGLSFSNAEELQLFDMQEAGYRVPKPPFPPSHQPPAKTMRIGEVKP